MVRLLASVGILLCALSPTVAQHRVKVRISDEVSGEAIPARVYLRRVDGKTPYFFESTSAEGTAVRYEKQNWINQASVEYHTTISPHPAMAIVPAGKYELVVEHGKTYFPHQQMIDVADDVDVSVSLRSWIDMAKRGWYSGDLHIHRSIDELKNIVLAEDLNVVFPLTQWVTLADTPPSSGNKNIVGDLPRDLVKVDAQHVIWPLSTEYEIFSVGDRRHTLGALFALGHQQPIQETVPPWKPVVDSLRKSDSSVLFDLDKTAWPFAMTLPVIVPDATYELANNHMWRADFAFRDWYTPTPNYMQPPFGGVAGDERDWIDFTWGMYYTLLNAGFRMPPSAGTANGVHPVPAGFGRVYVHLPEGFDYQSWKRGLQSGRSFVTTGPMVIATANKRSAGHTFRIDKVGAEIALSIEVISEQPITFGEVIVNGSPEHLLRVSNKQLPSGGYRSLIEQTIRPTKSGWFAIRFFEDRPNGRVRFAHTAPWYVELGDQPTRPSWEEREYLITRMKNELQRSRGIVSAEAIEEYELALAYYQALEVDDQSEQIARTARPLNQHRERWLRNMIVDHRFSAGEVRAATGLTIEAAASEIQRLAGEKPVPSSEVRVLPYPGGRHPRRGFLDGAIDPQRDTKISVFAPWNEGGYAVIDVPEAIFSNLGLTYLAHTHIPTIWSGNSIELEPIEWEIVGDDELRYQRTLPNGIRFGSEVSSEDNVVRMEMWLHNGTDQTLTGMRSQVCVMLKGLIGFNSKRRREAVVRGPLIAIKADHENRWVITGWEPNHRAWANPPVPCIHSDPIFPNCGPGETVRVRGAMWFYQGHDIEKALLQCEL